MHEKIAPPESIKPSVDVRSLGEKFIYSFNHLLKTAKIHAVENHLTIAAAQPFIMTGEKLMADKEFLTIEVQHGRVFIQGEKILLKSQVAVSILILLSYFENIGLHGLKFNEKFRKISPYQPLQLCIIINEAMKSAKPLDRLSELLTGEHFRWVDIIHRPRVNTNISLAQKVESAHHIYSYAYNAVKSVSQKILKNHQAGVRKSLRLVQDIIDFVILDIDILLGLCTIRDYDDYTYTHSVNVSILSICLGYQIGLSTKSLARLGICGLFHDLGKVDVSPDIINKTGPLNDQELKEIQKHSLNSVRQILKLHAYRDMIAKILLPPFEHHLKYDLSGYPSINWTKPISLFGRIISICDVYDALTGPRVYRPTVLSPDRALGMMFKYAGKDFDPILLKYFFNMLGVYPIGTFVKLDTGETGLIYYGGNSKTKPLPNLLLLSQTASGKYERGKIIDLNQRDPRSGKHLRNIKSTHHPSQFGIQPVIYMMQQ